MALSRRWHAAYDRLNAHAAYKGA